MTPAAGEFGGSGDVGRRNAPDDPDTGHRGRPEVVERSSHWRGWHVVARFIWMILVGMILLVIGVSPHPPHAGPVNYGPLFFWLGIVLIGAAFIGMLFTKCPDCYRSYWIMCYQEPDVFPDHGITEYYRDLAPIEDESPPNADFI